MSNLQLIQIQVLADSDCLPAHRLTCRKTIHQPPLQKHGGFHIKVGALFFCVMNPSEPVFRRSQPQNRMQAPHLASCIL